MEERDCLGKDVKRICLVAHRLFQQPIKCNWKGGGGLFTSSTLRNFLYGEASCILTLEYTGLCFVFFLLLCFREWWRRKTKRQRCVWMTHLLWQILLWSHTHTGPSALPPTNCSLNSHRKICFFPPLSVFVLAHYFSSCTAPFFKFSFIFNWTCLPVALTRTHPVTWHWLPG